MTSYIGFTNDVNKVNAAGLTKILEVNNLKGEPLCCSGRAVTACDWALDCVRFGACTDGGSSSVDAGVCTMPDAGGRDGSAGAGAGGAAGSRPDGSATGGAGGGSGGEAGAPPRGGAAGTGGATSGGTGGATSGGTGGATSGGTGGSTAGSSGSGTGGTGGSDESCKCRMATTSRDRSVAGLGLLLGLTIAGGWRRSRRKRAA